MKITQFLLSISFVLIFGCTTKSELENSFTSTNDTLFLKTVKMKGEGMIPGGASSLYLQDTTEFKDYQIIYPENITNMKISRDVIDFKPFMYGNMQKNKSDDLKKFLNDYYPDKIDTSNIPSRKDNSIFILAGKKGEEAIFIIDENNNKNFNDDSIRAYRKMDWHSKPDPIKYQYNIYNGKKLIQDSGWVNLGTNQYDELLFFVAHHIKSTFSINDNNYTLEIKNGPPFRRFCFENPILTLVEQNGIKKDSLLKSEMLEIGEYLKLEDSYYRFEDVCNDGSYLTLVKEKDVSTKIGTQIGFIAPDFNCLTLENDSISLKDYQGKYLLLINVSACWSEKSSYECYKEVTEYYKSKINILGIDNSPDFLQQNIKDLKLTGKFTIADENQSIKKNYREDFCSRTCFLINPKGRIVDKFEIFDWKETLKKHFN